MAQARAPRRARVLRMARIPGRHGRHRRPAPGRARGGSLRAPAGGRAAAGRSPRPAPRRAGDRADSGDPGRARRRSAGGGGGHRFPGDGQLLPCLRSHPSEATVQADDARGAAPARHRSRGRAHGGARGSGLDARFRRGPTDPVRLVRHRRRRASGRGAGTTRVPVAVPARRGRGRRRAGAGSALPRRRVGSGPSRGSRDPGRVRGAARSAAARRVPVWSRPGPGHPGLPDLSIQGAGRRLRDRGAPDAGRDPAPGATARGAARGADGSLPGRPLRSRRAVERGRAHRGALDPRPERVPRPPPAPAVPLAGRSRP